MKRILSLAGTIALVLAAVVVALQTQGSFPPLDWAKKGNLGPTRVAVLLEFGPKDISLRDWSGRATVMGAKVAHREGYRFHASDMLVGNDGWSASTHKPVRAPAGMPAITKLEPVASVGVVLHLEAVQPDAKIRVTLKDGKTSDVSLAEVRAGKTVGLWNNTAFARLVPAATPVATTRAEEDFPAAAYGPDGTLWVVYISYKHRDESRRIESPKLKEQPKNFKALYKPEFADQLFVKSCKDGQWSEPIAVSKANLSITRCAIAVDGKGNAHVVYSHGANGTLMLQDAIVDSAGKVANQDAASSIPVNADGKPGSFLTPAMTTDAAGDVWLAAQSWNTRDGRAEIMVWRHRQGKWEIIHDLPGGPGNCWHPAVAAAPNGQVAVAYDIYHHGSYDIRLAIFDAGKPATPKHVVVAASPKFEARPSIVYDPAGRLWIAYEEGTENWGKDYGSLVPEKGKPLYSARSVRVACLDTDGQLTHPTAELPTSTVEPPTMAGDALKTNLFERGSRYAYPKIGIDGGGRVWLSYRRNFGSRYSSHPGAYWLTFARRLDGQAWSEPIEVHHSDGLLDHRPVLLPHHAGGLLIVHNTDGRFTTPNDIDNQVYASVIDLPAKATALTLVAHPTGAGEIDPKVSAENAHVKRMKEHRLKVAGKTLQYLRGEYHRHTEISWDGSPDGSLEDMFRYAIDAVQFDWIGNGDHDNGNGREYSWWMTQKLTDGYHNRRSFTTMFTYERSVSYPHGHRNVMFAKRGIMTLPRLAPPAGAPPKEEGKKKAGWPGGVHPDDAKMLYRYLREFDGICASHTSATGMGTDWRDSDPVVEPIVEIYQGDRMSYEMEGAPRAGYDPKSGELPANVAGWYPKGFVNLALKKGIKLGFQASSDHWSTHISFFIILAEGRDRQSLLKAVKARHCYAATDNILVDFRCGNAIMGDDVAVTNAPTFDLHLVGTGKFAKIEILRDSEVIDLLIPAGSEFNRRWTDAKALVGTHYYYVRALQADGEIAWGSPIWVEWKK